MRASKELYERLAKKYSLSIEDMKEIGRAYMFSAHTKTEEGFEKHIESYLEFTRRMQPKDPPDET
jgi:hypothetical protein